jgi:hypothetical protein
LSEPPTYPSDSESALAEAEAPHPANPAAHAREVAEYISDMIGQLESMSRVAGFDLLVYLLSMARVEAETNARRLSHFGAVTQTR